MTSAALPTRPTDAPRARDAGTPRFRLDGRPHPEFGTAWLRSSASADVSSDDALGGLRLGDASTTALPPTEPFGTFGGLTTPTGLALGPDHALVLADPDADRLLVYDGHRGGLRPLWDARTDATGRDPYALAAPRGAAFTASGDLVVADTGHGRLVVLAWPTLAVRHVIGGLDEPWDVAADGMGGFYVADAGAGRVIRFDRLWRVDAEYEGGGLEAPRHLAHDAEGTLFVLGGDRRVVALDRRGRGLADPGAPLHRRAFPPPLRAEADGLAVPQAGRPGCPAVLLQGVEVDRSGRLLGGTGGSRPALLARPRGLSYPRTGVFETAALDSRIYACPWHRLTLDADVPEGTSLAVQTLTAPEPLAPDEVGAVPSGRWSRPLQIGPGDAPEVLLQSPPGRYLWLRLTFRSDGEGTPLVRSALVYAPRRSSLRFLPPVFREDPVGADFLDRFLGYFDTVFDEVEAQVEAFPAYLDPQGVPSGAALAWLGRWLGATFSADWPEPQRRAFVEQAVQLHRQRGTVAGLQALIRLRTGLRAPYPVVLEGFRLRPYAEGTARPADELFGGRLHLAGRPLDLGAEALPHRFLVVLPASAAPDADAEASLRALVEAEKPAHTQFDLLLARPGVRVGCQSTVGVDALLGTPPSVGLGALALDEDAVLSPSAC